MTPIERLERFENKYGTWSENLGLIEGDPNTPEQKEIRRRLHAIDRLAWMCVAYRQGRNDAAREQTQGRGT